MNIKKGRDNPGLFFIHGFSVGVLSSTVVQRRQFMAVDLSRTNIERNWKAPCKIPLQAVALTPPLSHGEREKSRHKKTGLMPGF
ncbi:hypothetical protein F1543_20100 [Enterobacter cloacae]|uniref:hypothetical protein n=1 Tax=Enterobacter cloacae TaxID=550 RepID=UPI001231B6D6|nr:hypothetical protein [Enterobacter cloacae]EKD5158432.1 hypothetical protein [Enterobacter cloacae]KAA5940554.1 hypothetical protein F1543_20100 [Enterobacter cloacae]